MKESQYTVRGEQQTSLLVTEGSRPSSRRKKRLRQVAVSGTVVLALGGCTSSGSDSHTKDVHVVRPTLPPDAAYSPDKKRMLSIGDSYSSGEGAPTTVKDSTGKDHKLFIAGTSDPNNHCHRSLEAYPVKLWEKLGDEWSLDFKACSGAVTQNIYDVAQYPKDPTTLQSNALISQKDPDLITMTMGGNDAHFADVITNCVIGGNVKDVRNIKRLIKDVADRTNCNIPKREQEFTEDLASLKEKLPQLYTDLKNSLAEEGQMIVAGYPKLFPDKPKGKCQTGLKSYFTKKDMQWINNAAIRANDAIEYAAAEAGISYVDTENLLTVEGKRHDACIDSGKDRWINRVSPSHLEWSFHPKAAAHALEAELFKQCYDDPSSCEPKPDPNALVGKALPLVNDCPYKDDPTFNQKLLINDIQYADVTADGIKDGLAVVECDASTSSWNETIRIFDGSTPENPPLIATLLESDGVKEVTMRVDEASSRINISGVTYSPGAPSADPDLIYRATFSWDGVGFPGESVTLPRY